MVWPSGLMLEGFSARGDKRLRYNLKDDWSGQCGALTHELGRRSQFDSWSGHIPQVVGLNPQ